MFLEDLEILFFLLTLHLHGNIWMDLSCKFHFVFGFCSVS